MSLELVTQIGGPVAASPHEQSVTIVNKSNDTKKVKVDIPLHAFELSQTWMLTQGQVVTTGSGAIAGAVLTLGPRQSATYSISSLYGDPKDAQGVKTDFGVATKTATVQCTEINGSPVTDDPIHAAMESAALGEGSAKFCPRTGRLDRVLLEELFFNAENSADAAEVQDWFENGGCRNILNLIRAYNVLAKTETSLK